MPLSLPPARTDLLGVPIAPRLWSQRENVVKSPPSSFSGSVVNGSVFKPLECLKVGGSLPDSREALRMN